MGKILNYEVTEAELRDSLHCLNLKKERWKLINVYIISAIIIFCLAQYIRAPEFLFWIAVSIICVFFMICLLYVPLIKEHIKLMKLLKRNHFQLNLDTVDITEIYETELVFTLCHKQSFYCIPKRLLSDAYELDLFREQLLRQCHVS